MTISAAQFRESVARPPLKLLLGPAGAGKTGWMLSRFTAGGGRALLLVSSAEQADTRAAQAAERTGRAADDFRPAIFTFRSLTTELLRSRESDGGRTIGRAFQRLILADVVKRHLHPEDYFGPMLRAPGFVSALTERIRDWKLACIRPDQLANAAAPVSTHLQDPTFALKAAEMARLYQAYEEFLTRNGLRDEEDLLHLATARVAAGVASLPGNADCLLVDGFYRFNPAQRLLLSALAGRETGIGQAKVEVAVTLPYDPARSLLFAAPERTLHTLRCQFSSTEEMLTPQHPDRPAALIALSDGVFAHPDTRRSQTTLGRPTPELPKTRTPEHQTPSPPILLFDAPNPYVEAEMVAREFRRLHAAGGYAWTDFAVILRAMGDYAPILAAVFERYEIPIGVDGPEALTENPLIKTVLHLLAVVRHGWQRDDVLAFLKSSYTASGKLAADQLRRQARTAGVREGRERWLALLEPHHTAMASIAAPLREMARYDSLFTAERVNAGAYADMIRDLIADFGLEERIALGEPTRRERDRAALQTALEVLYALAQMFTLAGRGTVGFAQFHDELVTAWRGASSLGGPAGDMVHVAEPYDARERSLKVAAVMGLTERVFPRRISEDPFLRDEERIALRQLANLDLEEQKGRADDERFLFYLAVTAPSERLILSYPRASDESDTLPSFFLDEVRAALGPSQLLTVSRTLADVAPRLDEAVSDHDRLLAACADMFDPGVAAPEREACVNRAALRLQECLRVDPSTVRRVLLSRSLPRLPRLNAPELRQQFADHRRVYSVSDLEAYGRCPFQYLLGHVMRLRPEEDGGHPRAQGALFHGVLRRYYRRRAAQQPDAPVDGAAMRAELSRLLTESLAEQPLDSSPHQTRMTQRLLADALDGFVEREQRFTTQFGLTPTHFALTFGMGESDEKESQDGAQDWNDLADHAVIAGGSASAAGEAGQDPASCVEPLLLLPTDNGPSVAVCGVIDRVDLDSGGRRALVLDYTLNRPPDYAEIQRGASLQMPLHLLALERLFGKVGAIACYDSSQERGRRRFHRVEHVNVRQFAPVLPLEDGAMVTPLNRDQFAGLVKTAEAAAIRLARAIETAEVPATPGDHCRQCAYSDICRTTLLHGHDGEQQGV